MPDGSQPHSQAETSAGTAGQTAALDPARADDRRPAGRGAGRRRHVSERRPLCRHRQRLCAHAYGDGQRRHFRPRRRPQRAENQRVAAGDVLFELDPEPLQIAVDRAHADLEAARNEISGLKAAYRQRQEDLKAAEIHPRHGAARIGAAGKAGRRQDHLADRFRRGAQHRRCRQPHRRRHPPGHLAHHLRAGRRCRYRPGAASEIPRRASDAGSGRARPAPRQSDGADRRRGGPGRCPAPGRLHPGRRAGLQHRQRRRCLDRGQSQGNRPHLRASRASTADAHHRFLSGPELAPPWSTASARRPASEFSVLPAQNATGNWVKVVQRIPVRLRVDRSARATPRCAPA